MLTILLADDHPVLLQGLRAVLEVEPDFRIIGETGDGLEVISLVEKLQPDILVLDYAARYWGIDTRLIKITPTTKIGSSRCIAVWPAWDV
jgi:DNA-binding NarL/FixJ family response regulator